VFYWMGSLPVIWCLLWAWLVEDDATTQCYITEKERNLIQKSLGDINTSHKVSNLCSCIFILISHVSSIYLRKCCDCEILMNVHALRPCYYDNFASTMLSVSIAVQLTSSWMVGQILFTFIYLFLSYPSIIIHDIRQVIYSYLVIIQILHKYYTNSIFNRLSILGSAW
jgi:hypothetical protein